MLDKAIKHGKEKRKPFYGSKAVDSTCRNHGSCPACFSNRMHKHRVKEEVVEEMMNDIYGMYDDYLD